MHPVLFRFGPVSVYSYGTMVALGVLLAVFVSTARAKRYNIEADVFFSLAVYTVLSGIVGARVLYVILHIREYLLSPFDAFKVYQGGLVFYGGLFAGLVTAALYIRRKKLDTWLIFDVVSPSMALAQVMARIGCFLNGCCYGRTVCSGSGLLFPPESSAGAHFPGQALYPVQLYSAAGNLAIFAALFFIEKRKVFVGEVFAWYLFLYSAKRFFVEFYRANTEVSFFGLSIFQLISIVVAAVSFFFIVRGRLKSNGENPKQADET